MEYLENVYFTESHRKEFILFYFCLFSCLCLVFFVVVCSFVFCLFVCLFLLVLLFVCFWFFK